MKKALQIVIVFVIFSLIPSCIPTVENSLTAPPHFRQVWWGNTKETIIFKEKGKPVHENTGGSLVYKTRYNDVPVLLVYCFSNHSGIYRLRAAGYLTLRSKTLDNPDRVFRKELLNTHGEPTKTLEDGGMLWLGQETVVYTNTYRDATASNTQLSRRTTGSILTTPKRHDAQRWHLIAGYIDREFYEEIGDIKNKRRLYAELTYYEQIFFGMFRSLQQP